MRYYLMQHGLAGSAATDSERALTPEGDAQVRQSAEAIRRMRLGFDLIVASPKKRSLQTARIVARAVGYPDEAIHVTPAVVPDAAPDEMLGALREFPDRSSILIAGHLPSLMGLAGYLLTDGPPARVRLKNAGLCCLEATFPLMRNWELVFYLTPEQLALISVA